MTASGSSSPRALVDYATKGRLGIIGMEQRILAIGGTIRLHSSPGSGTILQATIPYSTSDEIIQVENA